MQLSFVAMLFGMVAAGQVVAGDGGPLEARSPRPHRLGWSGRDGGQGGVTPSTSFWLNGGVGASAMGVAGDASMNLRVKRLVFKVGWWGTTESGFEMFRTSAWDEFSTISILGGWVFPMSAGQSAFVVHTGLSMATLTENIPIPGSGYFGLVDFRSVTSTALGWPVQVGFLAPTRSGVGFTMNLMLDVNAERTVGAFTLGLRLGRMYPR